ncbi:MAG: hypothetical protein AB1646_06660 [Thermodesulfobacteriota bacterium]
MSTLRCHRCGHPMEEGSLKYEVVLRVRSLFDGVIPPQDGELSSESLSRLIADLSAYTEEEANREIYEDDVFTMCPECKEVLIKDIYAHFLPHSAPEADRPYLIN